MTPTSNAPDNLAVIKINSYDADPNFTAHFIAEEASSANFTADVSGAKNLRE